MTKVFAIVVTYNGETWINTCLTSLQNSSFPVSIIVVDNHSSDSTVRIIRESFPYVQLIEKRQNLGFGKANNAGIRMALNQGAEYVFLLNQDAWIVSDALQKLISVIRVNKEYAIISPIHLSVNTNKLEWYFSTYVGPEYCDGFYSDCFLKQTQCLYSSSFINAAAWLVNCEHLIKVGGFDPIFFHYGEDEDYCARVLYHGMKIGVCTDAVIVHDKTYTPYKRIATSLSANKNFALVK